MSDTQADKPNAAEEAENESSPVDGAEVDASLAAAEASARALGEQAGDADGDAEDAMRTLTDEVDDLVSEVHAVCGISGDELDDAGPGAETGDDAAAGEIAADLEMDAEEEIPPPPPSRSLSELADVLSEQAGERERGDHAGASAESNEEENVEALLGEVAETCGEDPASEGPATESRGEPEDLNADIERLLAQDRAQKSAAAEQAAAENEAGTDPMPPETTHETAQAELAGEVQSAPGERGDEGGDSDPVAKRGEPSKRDGALQAMDEALADDVDDLMDRGVQAVSAVLEEDEGVLPPARSEAEPPPADVEEAAGKDQINALDDDSSFESFQEVVGEETDDEPEPGETVEADQAEEGTEEAQAEESVPLPDPEETEVEPVEEAKGPIDEGKDASETEAEASVAPEPEPKSEPKPEPEPEPEPRSEEAVPGRTGIVGRLPVCLDLAASVLVPALTQLNYPLRLVPERYRPLVDWFALSLVFWIPIVWILAFFLIGR